MAVTNVACPFCGGETLVTVPIQRTLFGEDRVRLLKTVVQNASYEEPMSANVTVHAACQICNSPFGVVFD